MEYSDARQNLTPQESGSTELEQINPVKIQHFPKIF